ncbi:hypothetical protein CFIO01_12059 [Colletotrichum fioriniae PJ7]|uniref:Uncharacterized protein n=1 Tax=Colletotrichum fioriniae PJ7 TaxID=1445577 RepID=A0A010RVT0_9PEZI|nr:hypothetical protein CFIO01_12059 [Colletotrichum fioriniae PJ7]
MVHIPSTAAGLVALAATTVASATAPKLNTWRQHNYGGWYNHTDGDVTTYGAPEFRDAGPLSIHEARFSFLFNGADPAYAGLYVLSSGEDFITDYEVVGYGWGRPSVTGKVCGAKGNFTFVQLFGPDGLPNTKSTTDTMFIDVSAARNNASRAVINEVWPVWVGDDIFYPNNTSPCPAPAAKTKRWSA